MRSLSRPAGKRSLSVRDIALLGVLGALMFATQVAMAALPNIHVVAVLIILATLFFGWRAMYSVAVFVLLEGLVYGFGIWWINYLYTWPILVVLVMLLPKSASSLFWGCVGGGFGLSFGALCSIPYFIVGGWAMGFSYWVSGVPFDLIHCVGNFVLTWVLLKPLYKAMSKVTAPAFPWISE